MCVLVLRCLVVHLYNPYNIPYNNLIRTLKDSQSQRLYMYEFTYLMTIVTTRAHLSWGSWQSQDDRSVNIPVKESKLRTRVAPTTFKHIRYRLAHHRASLVVYERRI